MRWIPTWHSYFSLEIVGILSRVTYMLQKCIIMSKQATLRFKSQEDVHPFLGLSILTPINIWHFFKKECWKLVRTVCNFERLNVLKTLTFVSMFSQFHGLPHLFLFRILLTSHVIKNLTEITSPFFFLKPLEYVYPYLLMNKNLKKNHKYLFWRKACLIFEKWWKKIDFS